MLDVFLFFASPDNLLISSSTPVARSGRITASAPPAIPDRKAIQPESRPITSIKNKRLCDAAVSLILSIASITVFVAVSYPIVKSEPLRSLSIVPGIQMVGILKRLESLSAPRAVPSPPIGISASIPYSFKLVYAFFVPSSVLNSRHLAVLRMVPPKWIIFPTERAFMSQKSLSSIP